jgi:hypothetical protein
VTIDPQYRPTRTPLTESAASAEAYRLIREAYDQEAAQSVTQYRDTTPVPAIGTRPPVMQPETRTVPQWAAGVAVASIGVGAGVTGLGCGAWLILQGLASVTLYGVLAVTLPFAGAAAVVTAIGAAVSRAKSATTTNIFKGSVVQRTEITSTARGMLTSARIER